MFNIIILVLLTILVAILIFLTIKAQKQPKHDALGLMQQQLDGLRGQVNESFKDLSNNLAQNLHAINQQVLSSQQTVGQRLDSATQGMGQVQRELGALSQATQRVFEVGKDISSLQEILRAPKMRGELGELFLGDLLNQVLPASHVKQQYKFKSGDTVDAVICLGQGMVSVDSKFPLENFRRIMGAKAKEEKKQARKTFISDVKKHIDAIANKYILPDEGTFDFALMYIPAENIYYEVIIKDSIDEKQSLSTYALKKKVIPVSPNSFYAYLQAIVLGLKGLRVEENVQQIISHLERLRTDMQKFKQDFEVLGRHIVNLKNKYDETDKRVTNFEGKLLTICQVEKEEKFLNNDQ